MSEDDDNVIDLPIAFSRRRLDISSDRGKVPGECNHTKLRVRRATRLVICETCEAELDQFLILTQLLDWQRTEQYRAAASEKEAATRRESIEKLKKEEAKLRKRIREAHLDDPTEAFKAETLQQIADWIDSAFEKGEEVHVERLEALERICDALFRPIRSLEQLTAEVPENPAHERFRRKIQAAIEEIKAREKRKRIMVVK